MIPFDARRIPDGQLRKPTRILAAVVDRRHRVEVQHAIAGRDRGVQPVIERQLADGRALVALIEQLPRSAEEFEFLDDPRERTFVGNTPQKNHDAARRS